MGHHFIASTRKLVFRHGWLLVLLVGLVLSLMTYQYLQQANSLLLKSEMARRSEIQFASIQTSLHHHLDKIQSLRIFFQSRINNFNKPEITRYIQRFMQVHPGELLSVGLLPTNEAHAGPRILVNPGKLPVPTVEPAILQALSTASQQLQLLQRASEKWLLRVFTEIGEQQPEYLVVADLNLSYIFEEAMVSLPTAGLDVMVSWVQGPTVTPVYQHISRLRKKTGEAGGWQQNLVVGNLQLRVSTTAMPDFSSNLPGLTPAWSLVAGTVLSLLLSLLLFNHIRTEDRMETTIDQRSRNLRARQWELDNIVEHASESILLLDASGTVLRTNRAACRLFGHTAEEWSSLTIGDLISAQSRQQYLQWFDEKVDHGTSLLKSKALELSVQRKDRSLCTVELTINHFLDQQDRGLQSVIMRDITERHYREWITDTLLLLRDICQQQIPLQVRLKKFLSLLFGEPWALTDLTGAIFVLHDRQLWLIASHDWNVRDKQDYLVMPLEDHPCSKALVSGKYVITPRVQIHKSASATESSRVLCLPLIIGSQPLGAVQLALNGDREIPASFLNFCVEISEILAQALLREQSQQKLEDSESQNRMLLEITPIGVLIVVDDCLVYTNQAFMSELHITEPDELLGHMFTDFTTSQDRGAIIAKYLQLLYQGDQLQPVEEHLKRPDNSCFWAQIRGIPIEYQSQHAALLLVDDIDEKKIAEDRLAWLSYYDDLTGLANRRLILECLNRAIANARREQKPLAILYLDLDRFKQINDSLGHDSGDLVLKNTATRLHEPLRETDTTGRLGGDEFVVLLPGAGEQAAGSVARKVSEAIGKPQQIGNNELVVGCSIGIVVFPEDGENAADLLKHADTAMYYAKSHHLDSYRFSRELDNKTSHRLFLGQHLVNAVSQDQLELYYQAKYQLSGNPSGETIVGMECLVRWQHPELGLVLPTDFIPLAEETGLIRPITRWLLHKAARQAVAWEQAGILPGRLGINISASQLVESHLAQEILEVFQAAGAQPEWFEVEITETAIMHDPDAAIKTTRQLVKAGTFVAIDDFGTGYSSLVYLKRLTAQCIKIEKDFIRHLPDDRENAAIVKSIISLAYSLGMQVTAEGVKNSQQLEFLREAGCHAVQGYFFSRPLPSDEATRYLNEHKSH